MAKQATHEEIVWAGLADGPPGFALRRPRRTGRRAQGIRYERKVHEYLEREFGEAYLASLWLQYRTAAEDRLRWCQPDGLLFDVEAGRITIFEVKYQHTPEAWWQLHRYLDVLRQVFPADAWEFALCEVVKWYDCAVRFPGAVHLMANPGECRPGKFHVHIWKP